MEVTPAPLLNCPDTIYKRADKAKWEKQLNDDDSHTMQKNMSMSYFFRTIFKNYWMYNRIDILYIVYCIIEYANISRRSHVSPTRHSLTRATAPVNGPFQKYENKHKALSAASSGDNQAAPKTPRKTLRHSCIICRTDSVPNHITKGSNATSHQLPSSTHTPVPL